MALTSTGVFAFAHCVEFPLSDHSHGLIVPQTGFVVLATSGFAFRELRTHFLTYRRIRFPDLHLIAAVLSVCFRFRHTKVPKYADPFLFQVVWNLSRDRYDNPLVGGDFTFPSRTELILSLLRSAPTSIADRSLMQIRSATSWLP
ncbi:hypothetical protein [Leptospira noguchii]|uniref:hypothetical protein n=1 Tax=Leptospira noguchii TaxID=28182 RepID=UPI001FB6D26A|nr:hypothetical protein [Leptospira noguchii]UOG36310.1 hypothetical protein MAL02_19370 [Leptospira noguchii]